MSQFIRYQDFVFNAEHITTLRCGTQLVDKAFLESNPGWQEGSTIYFIRFYMVNGIASRLFFISELARNQRYEELLTALNTLTLSNEIAATDAPQAVSLMEPNGKLTPRMKKGEQ